MYDSLEIFHEFVDILENSGLGCWRLVDEECGEYHFFDNHGGNLSAQFLV